MYENRRRNFSGGDPPPEILSQVPPPPFNSQDSIDQISLGLPPPPPPTRWGRSNFTPEEINALDTPTRMSIPPPPPPPQSRELTKCQKILQILLIAFPPMCFASAAHLVNDVRTDLKLFGASFSIFQGVFWPSVVFLGVDLITRSGRSRRTTGSVENSEGGGGIKWKVVIFFFMHSACSSLAVILQLVSIQRLNISVSLALSFSSVIFVILLSYINREKRCSAELLIFAVLGYCGFITAGIPAMTSKSQRFSEDQTAGLASSLASMGLAIPSSFLLWNLRKNSVGDSLIATSFAILGSIFTLLIKIIAESNSDKFPSFDKMSFGWAAGLISLVIVGTIGLFMEAKFTKRFELNARGSGGRCVTNISRMRILIFINSCVAEIIRQGINNTFPDPYDILGSILVISAFLLAVGFEAWSLAVEDERSTFCHFIPWLFSGNPPRGNVKI